MAVKPRSQTTATKKKSGVDLSIVMPFTRENYILMVGCIAIIILSFVLMAVENEADGWISLWLSPYLMVGGYAGLAFAILYRKKEKTN
ncbi:MAG: DUF3098 domain-containing protein [Bacteroidetes bacterium]|nr:DUF3098 domain-containing protein [Bacteroidota bacterium]